MFKIEKNVPYPMLKVRHTGFTATLRKMEIGDSVLIPPDKVNSCRAMTYQMHNRSARRFSMRLQADGSTRLWRTK